MYGYASDNDITAQQVLQKVSQEEIFEFILGVPFDMSERYLSPLRLEDTRPGCRFDIRADGAILFIDFGDKIQTHNTCFGLVMRYHNVRLQGAVSIIIAHFNLSDDYNDYIPVDKVFAHKEYTPRTISTITYDKIDYVKRDKLYWSNFLITTDQLLSDNVFSTNKFYIEREGSSKKSISIMAPCYAIDFISRVKLYQPFSNKYRFITNCDENNIGNFDSLPRIGDNLVIAKSYKDHRVIRNFLLKIFTIWFQNEGCVPSLEILKNLTERFVNIIIFFDNDKAGIEAAIKLTNIFNSFRPDCTKMIHLPIRTDRTMQWKDPGEFIKKEGQYDLIKTFKEILLWQNIRL